MSARTIKSTGQKAGPDPWQLLRALDGWMAAAHYGADHPWRVSIAQAVSKAPAAAVTASDAHAEAAQDVFAQIAMQADTIIDLLQNHDDALTTRDLAAVALARNIGCVADIAYTAMGGAGIKGTEAWLLAPATKASLLAMGGAA